MSKKETKILLCKGLSPENDTQEPYKLVLETAGYVCSFLPALQFEFVNLTALRECLAKHHLFSGLILTSQRSVEAISIVMNADSMIFSNWEHLPVYCVGAATASLVKKYLKLINCLGEESGNAKELAMFIVNNSQDITLPFLYPCSEIARDTIDRVLSNKNIPVKKLVTYRTLTSATLEIDFKKAIEILPKVIVFFSPSVVNSVTPLLQKVCDVAKQNIKIVAIGPITSAALTNVGFKVDGISEKPEPLALLKSVNLCINEKAS